MTLHSGARFCESPAQKQKLEWGLRSSFKIALIAGCIGLTLVLPLAAQAASNAPSGDSPPRLSTAAQPVAPTMSDIHDIKPLIALGSALSPVAYALIGAAGLVVLGLILFLLKRRTGKKALPQKAPVPPERAALEQLGKIRDVAAMDGRLFYFELSAILRTYLEGRFGLNAPEMTTEELLPKIEPIGLPEELTAPFKALLLSADPVKFAAFPAGKHKMETDLGFAYAFVERTTPAEKDKTGNSNP